MTSSMEFATTTPYVSNLLEHHIQHFESHDTNARLKPRIIFVLRSVVEFWPLSSLLSLPARAVQYQHWIQGERDRAGP